MEINNALQQNISSIRHSIGISMLKKSMNQDAQTMSALLEGMNKVNTRIMESSVTPHKGANINVRV